MSMIRKIIPVSLYDIPGLEGWLEEQASQGLFPTSLGSWAVFEDRGLPGTRFRLDPFAYAEPHVRWCERSENESRKKTASFSSYSI